MIKILINIIQSIFLITILTGCNSKIEEKTTTINAHSEQIKNTEISIASEKEKSFKTVSFYNQNKHLRKKRIRECRKMKDKTIEIEKDCKNAKRSLQLSKRKNTNSFIDQKFL